MPSSFLKQIASRFVVTATGVAAASLLTLAAARPVAAQEADGDFEGEKQYVAKDGSTREIKEPNSRERKKFNDLFPVGKASSKEEEQLFEDIAHYYVYALTWKENASHLDQKRKDLKNKVLVPAGQKNRTVTDLHKRLNELTLTTCRAVAEDAKYPRVIRIGCVLMMGELDSQEVQPGVSAAVPLPEATSALKEMASNPKEYLPLRILAVIGLIRQAHPPGAPPTAIGIAAPLQAQVVDSMLAILDEPVAERKQRTGQVWLRFRTAELLQVMASKQIPIDQSKLAAAVTTLIADETIPAWERARLAGELGRVDAKSLQATNVAPAVRSLAALMLAASQASPFLPAEPAEEEDEEKKADDKKDPKKKDEGKDEKNDEKKDEISPAAQKVSSEELLWQLSQIRLALYGKEAATAKTSEPSAMSGLFVAADDTTKAVIAKIVNHIDQIVKSLSDSKTFGTPKGMEKLGDMLVTANQDLEDLLTVPAAEETQVNSPPGAPRPRPQGGVPAEESKVSE